jgi:DNA-binding CsgD family transcriptional regulator
LPLEKAQAAAPDQAHRLVQWQTLTPREREVARLVCQGLSRRQAARQLNISPETVKTHLAHIRAKLEAGSLAELRGILAGCDFVWAPEPHRPPDRPEDLRPRIERRISRDEDWDENN